MQEFSEKFKVLVSKALKHKRIVITVGLVLAVGIVSAIGVIAGNHNDIETESQPPVSSQAVATEIDTVSQVSEVSSEESTVTEQTVSEEKTVTSSKKPTTVSSKPTVTNTVSKSQSSGEYKYNSNTDINNNVFLDALVYTGYNLKKHIADGNMWKYILASQKRGLGYLSNIGYAGGSTGYETSGGKPDIKLFEKRGLVCASYVTYVYFNYLPNVAGIDTSSLTRPNKSYSANDWYIAAKDWVNKGYSTTISFTASRTSSGYINFRPEKEIPIGSIMAFCDAKNRSDYCSHVAIYAGYQNGYNWVYHVGNDNGPEFCAVERMYFGPDPQWPIKVITTPSNIRMQAALEISLKDNNGNPVSGAEFSLNSTESGKVVSLGKTDTNGVIVKENLTYGEYELTEVLPNGYTADSTTQKIKLTTANNSYNKVAVTNALIPPVVPSDTSSSEASSDETPSDTASDATSEEQTSSTDSSEDKDTSSESNSQSNDTQSDGTTLN